METPHLPRAIFGPDFENVYEPAEDTFLLLDALEADLAKLAANTRICLECGSGSGAIVTALSKAFDNISNDQQDRSEPESLSLSSRPLIIATDVNIEACKTTKKCANYHQQQHRIQIVQTNLAQSLVDRLEHSVDLLIFNPPYVPTDTQEKVDESSTNLQLAWAGGSQGRDLTDAFLQSYVPKLLSKPDGVAYLVALDKNNIRELSDCLVKDHKIKGTIAMERQAGIEHLYVLKYRWMS